MSVRRALLVVALALLALSCQTSSEASRTVSPSRVSPTSEAPGPPSSTPPPSSLPSGPDHTGGPIAYIGCSNTVQTVAGYHAAGGTRFWPSFGTYGGATIQRWAAELRSPSSGLWGTFQGELQQEPAKVVWVQLCAFGSMGEEQTYAAAVTVIQEVRRLIPGAVVFVSPLNGYVAPHVCGLTGPDGTARTASVADRLASDGVAFRGPNVGDLLSTAGTPSEGATSANTQTDGGGCHPNSLGERFLGKNLMKFPAFQE